jgi:hypothetical protein
VKAAKKQSQNKANFRWDAYLLTGCAKFFLDEKEVNLVQIRLVRSVVFRVSSRMNFGVAMDFLRILRKTKNSI